jgi:hypothetical protein
VTGSRLPATGSTGPRRGVRSPGRTGRRRPATDDGVTDRNDGNSLEDGGLGGATRAAMPETAWWRGIGQTEEEHQGGQGTGRPESPRRVGGVLRGVVYVAGNAQVFGLSCRKRDEPHGRQRDATSPRAVARRKPSRWCETTRTEQDFGIGIPEPKDEKLASHPGVDARGDLARGVRKRTVDGGATGRDAGASQRSWSNPMRGVRREPGRATDGSSEVEPKRGSTAVSAAMQDGGRCFAEDLEGPFRPGNRAESKAREDAVNAMAAATPHASQDEHR